MSDNLPLPNLPAFESLPAAAVQALMKAVEQKPLAAGEPLFCLGELSDACYLVLSGHFRAVLRHASGPEFCATEFMPGDWIGELALFSNQPRRYTVIAGAASEVLILPTQALDCLDQEFPGLVSVITGHLMRQYQIIQASIILTNLFGPLEDATLRELRDQVHWQHLHSGETLFHEGDPGNALYVVVQGRLRFSVKEANGSARVLGEVGAGENIGEFALLAAEGTPESLRSATVYATRLSDVVSITRPVFENLMRQYPQAVLNLTRRIIHRQRLIDQSALLGKSALVMCVLPTEAGLTSSSPHSEFARRLADTLADLGCTQWFDPSRFEAMYGKRGAARTPLDHPASLMINAWMDEQECSQQFVIYDAVSDPIETGCLSPWAQRCVEDADLVLLVAEAGEHANLSSVERCLQQVKSGTRVELVLLHPAGCRLPVGTSAWLSPGSAEAGPEKALPFQNHHHVRMGHAPDLRRLARRISGHPVGLTLSGGGARGWAHIGVIRALEEAQVEIDWVGGASMGSIIAAAYALDWNYEQLNELAMRFADPKKLLDYTFPYASITATRRITGILQQFCAGAAIEDTWRPFYCISSDLTRNIEQVHLTGSLWKAIRASMAFPTVFAPLFDQGSILIDGGAINNLPVDRMRELCPTGTVIGVNLDAGTTLSGPYQFGSHLSGWQALLSRMTPFYQEIKAPTLLEIVSGLVENTTRYRLNETRHCADLIIEVPVKEYSILDFHKYREIVEIGYTTAQEALQGFKPG